MIDDQEHLSAVYMRGKAQGLIARCVETSARLEVLQRREPSLLLQSDLAARMAGLATSEQLDALRSAQRASIHARARGKVDTRTLRARAESLGLAPAAQLDQLQSALAEVATLVADRRQAAILARNHAQIQAALIEAGWTHDGRGGITPPLIPTSVAKSSKKSTPPLPPPPLPPAHFPTADTGVASRDTDVDDLTALLRRLDRIEQLAPEPWQIKQTMAFIEHKHSDMSRRYDTLQNELTTLSSRFARSDAKRFALKRELEIGSSSCEEDGSGGQQQQSQQQQSAPAPSSGSLTAQQIRAELDALSTQIHGHTAGACGSSDRDAARRLQDLSQALVAQMTLDRSTALTLQAQFRARDAQIKNECKARGIDLDTIAMELEQPPGSRRQDEIGGDDEHEAANGSEAACFDIGVQSRTFVVRFARDGSGRLVQVNRAQASNAMSTLGLQSASSSSAASPFAPSATSSLDEVSFESEDAALRWSAEQLRIIRRRMDERFEALHTSLDALRAENEAATTEQRMGVAGTDPLDQSTAFAAASASCSSALLARLRLFSAALAQSSSAVSGVRSEFLARLRGVSLRTRTWEAQHLHFQLAHREALGLFQRMEG